MSKWIAEFKLEDGDIMPEHMDLNYKGAKIDFHCRPMWIPVSKRLPESDEEYHTFLVTDNKGRVTLSEFYLSISDRKPYWSGMIDVIAWMPLPEPYKAESEE